MLDLEGIKKRRKEIECEIIELENKIETSIKEIIDGVSYQRWFLFENNKKIIFDRETGLLWSHPDHFPYLQENYEPYSCDSDLNKIINSVNLGFSNFKIPTSKQLYDLTNDNEFVEYMTDCCDVDFSSDLTNEYCWFVLHEGSLKQKNLAYGDFDEELYDDTEAALLVCSDCLISNICYNKDDYNKVIELFKNNKLKPIIDYSNCTELYDKVYNIFDFSLKKLKEEYEELINPIINSSNFDYKIFLENYDIDAINKSIIKYYQAIQSWIDTIMMKFNSYEQRKEVVINNISNIGIILSKKYKNSECFSEEENEFFRDRQHFFASKISLGMNSVKTKLLSLKKQADDLEYRIDEIDCGNDAIRQLAVIEREERASFEFIAENTAKIICNALKKVEYFEANHEFVKWIIESWKSWTESYHIFKTSYYTKLKESCKEDSIDGEIFEKWYSDWQELRFSIEQKMQPIIEKELRERIPMINVCERTVSQQILSELEEYKNNIDKFYCEERKGIYQNYVFQANGEIQDKLETESRIYKFTAQFQKSLQNIIFNCEKSEDRIFILDWAGSLLDIQIDDIIELIADNEIKEISDTVLTEFSQLKQRNYEFYLADAKSYGEEQEKRDKEFNSLLFKMRKGIVSK